MKGQVTVLELIRSCIAKIDLEISAHIKGEGTVGTMSQLEYIQNSLRDMAQQLEGGALPKRRFGISRIVADSWPLCSELGELLVTAEKAYEHLVLRSS